MPAQRSRCRPGSRPTRQVPVDTKVTDDPKTVHTAGDADSTVTASPEVAETTPDRSTDPADTGVDVGAVNAIDCATSDTATGHRLSLPPLPSCPARCARAGQPASCSNDRCRDVTHPVRQAARHCDRPRLYPRVRGAPDVAIRHVPSRRGEPPNPSSRRATPAGSADTAVGAALSASVSPFPQRAGVAHPPAVQRS